MKIYARNCEIVDISKETMVQFLNENHSQGYASSIVNYGLIYKDELVQIMSFGKPRFNKFYSWELIRDCTKNGIEVVGGVSKLWKHFVDNNTVRSCICYSYPHESSYTNKYVDYCGFTNLEKAKPSKKVYFEGVWNGKAKRIDKSILERHGVDRLLKGNFGHDRTNEEILLDLGFKKKTEDGLNPQVDSYFPAGIVYKITDLNTGKFYIGETFKKDEFVNCIYNGSDGKWTKYYNKHKDLHNFKREILKDNFKTPKELYDFEVSEIRKYCNEIEDGKYLVDHSTGCMNVKTQPQPEMPICPECGGLSYNHHKTCSMYKPRSICPICGSVNGHHKHDCPNLNLCPECGGKDGRHKKTCSKYNQPAKCPECGSSGQHKKTCSKYKPSRKPDPCPECGSIGSNHKKTCSKYNKPSACEECGSCGSHHKKSCSKYKSGEKCPECGGIGRHYKTCSKYTKPAVCPECGGKGGHHKTECSHYKKSAPCPICGSYTTHKMGCKYYKVKVCPECGGKLGRHYKTCSKYKPQSVCPICGRVNGHLKDCPNIKICTECGGLGGNHLKTCSKYKFTISDKICEECGGKGGKHKAGCSKKKTTICPECGGKSGKHKSSCSKAKKCPECGYMLQSNMHAKTCSHYINKSDNNN